MLGGVAPALEDQAPASLAEEGCLANGCVSAQGSSARVVFPSTWQNNGVPEPARYAGVASEQVQKQTRLCITRDLTEKDVVSRIMRKENYLIGLLNKARTCALWPSVKG